MKFHQEQIFTFHETFFEGIDLSYGNFKGLVFVFHSFYHCNLKGTDLSNCTLSGNDFSDADLSFAILCNSDLRGAFLKRADLTNCIINKYTKGISDELIQKFGIIKLD